VKLKALASWIFLSFTSFWRNSDSYEYKNKSARRGVFTFRNWFVMQGPVAIILISWNVIFNWETGYWTRAIRYILIKRYFWHFCWLPYLYTFSLYENPSLIIVSAETEYISTRSWYRNINLTVVNSVLKFMISGTTSILKS
jgi:hypothetical protein